MRRLIEGNIYKTFILFAIPIVLSGLLTQSSQLINTMIAGRFLGSDGLAAVGAGSGFITLISSASWGYTNGVCIYLAQLFGSGDVKRFKTAAYNFLAFSVALLLVLSAVSIAFRYPILRMLNTDEKVLDDAATYFAIYIGGLPLSLITFAFTCVLHALGVSAFPLIVSLLTGFLHVFGNLLAVGTWGMGIVGLAAIPAVTGVISCALLWWQLRRYFVTLNVQNEKVVWGFADTRAALRFSLPTIAQQMTMYFASFLISPFVNVLGSSATAGFSVVMRFFEMNTGVYQNSSKTLTNYVAQSVGARQYHNLRRSVRVGFLQGFLLSAPFVVVSAVFAEPICRLFFGTVPDNVALGYAVDFARIFLPFAMVNLLNNLFHAFCRGIGAMKLLYIATSFGAVSRILLTVWLAPLYGMNGIYLAWVISWGLEATLDVILYVSGSWKKALPNYR